MVLASKDRITFHLSDLVEFGADQGDLTKTVFYHPIENKLYIGKSVPFPIIFTPSAVLFYGIYWLTESISLHGFLPLVLSFIIMFLIARWQFKHRKQNTNSKCTTLWHSWELFPIPEIKWIENLSFDFRLWIIHYRAIDTIPFLG